MAPRVLHVLGQRPGLTGSGVTLDACVRATSAAWPAGVVCALPAGDPTPTFGGVPQEDVYALTFAGADGRAGTVPFPVPGMSDVMPYPSTVFSAMSAAELDTYRAAWRAHLASAVERFRPDLVHVHHAWLVAGLAREAAAGVPVVVHVHGTGLRQLERCPGLVPEVVDGAGRADAFAVLHDEQARAVVERLGVPPARVTVVGAGYDESVFHARDRTRTRARLLFAGKLAHAKGLPWLIDAVECLHAAGRDVELAVAGGGEGAEADALRARVDALAGATLLGRLPPAALAVEMRASDVFVLPSLYEGLPLVLVEAAACGCRLVATELPGAVTLAPALGAGLELVTPPERDVDVPRPGTEAAFRDRLAAALAATLDAADHGGGVAPAADLSRWRWSGVAGRLDRVWRRLLD